MVCEREEEEKQQEDERISQVAVDRCVKKTKKKRGFPDTSHNRSSRR
jgi:hypothetical protein